MAYKPLLIPDPFVFPAYPPELPERQRGDLGGPEYVIKAAVKEEHERGLTLVGTTQTDASVTITVSAVAPGIVRVLLEAESAAPQRVTLARDLSDQAVDVMLERTDDQVTLVSDGVRMQIDLDPFHITFYGPDGGAILDQNYSHRDVTDRMTMLPLGFSAVEGRRVAFHDTFTAQPDEHFYGFGEKFTTFDKRGQRLEMWQHNTYGVHSERAYKNVPFFVSTRGYGIFVDSITCIRFDMAASNHATFSLVVPDTALDYYVIAGPELKTIIARYASLVSFSILPPKWAFGLWMSSGFQHDSTDDVLRRARLLREHDIPCDVLHLDCYWQRHGTWSGMEWDRGAFPDPEGLIQQIKDLGYRVCLWENPYLGVESERFSEAKEKGYLLKTPQGEAYILDLWDGYHPPVGIIDFTNPGAVAWCKELRRSLLRMGVDVFKTDFGESVPPDAVAYNGMTGERLHNLYPLLYNDAVSEVTAEETGRAGLVWARSTYAGGQRHAAQWGGDASCTYQGMASTLRGGLSIGMCGHAFWSHDIGGFYIQPTPELYVRWAQFGLLSPLSRAHGVTTRLPWDYGEEAMRIFRDYVRLRYRLLPYIYTYACIAAETSLPMMRAMVLEFPDDPNTCAMDLQYMFGSELLVAPIYNSEGRRSVYFPTGRWVDFWTHEVIEGPQTRWLEVALDVLPLYIRGNALIPTIEPLAYLTDAPFGLVTFDAYLLDRGSFELRDSDGTTRISASFEGVRLNIQVEGVKRTLGLRLIPLPGVPSVDTVHVNGVALHKVDALEISPDAAAGWTCDPDGTVQVMIHVTNQEGR
jgi:alpha-D-xyloside xylohydrolase